MTSKEHYRQQVQTQPLFHQPFWLDEVAGNNWDVAIIKSGETITAAMPFAFIVKSLGKFIRGPVLTQFVGPWFYQQNISMSNKEAMILQLYSQLPRFALYNQRWHFSLNQLALNTNQPFKIEKRITHILPLQPNIFDSFSDKTKREITKAQKLFEVTNMEAQEFYAFVSAHLAGKNFQVPFESKLLERVFSACHKNDCGKIIAARDDRRQISAALFIAWDADTAYYITGARDATGGNNGAMSFLFNHIFEELMGKVSLFDFEGSVIPGIAAYFKSFGAEVKEYPEITMIPSPLVRTAFAFKRMLGQQGSG